jgi:hypothetical protein
MVHQYLGMILSSLGRNLDALETKNCWPRAHTEIEGGVIGEKKGEKKRKKEKGKRKKKKGEKGKISISLEICDFNPKFFPFMF